jgi:hypothetical protein
MNTLFHDGSADQSAAESVQRCMSLPTLLMDSFANDDLATDLASVAPLPWTSHMAWQEQHQQLYQPQQPQLHQIYRPPTLSGRADGAAFETSQFFFSQQQQAQRQLLQHQQHQQHPHPHLLLLLQQQQQQQPQQQQPAYSEATFFARPF